MKAFFACLLTLLCGVIVFGQVSAPYSATVVGSQSPVLAAPFSDQYVCSYLQPGDQVQVYRETKNGYLAIRPLHESYSWVLSSDLELHADGDHGTVGKMRVPSWIGSQYDKAVNYGYTVLLNRGEVVTVLGQQDLALAPGQPTQTYYKIAPPAGEFRWLHQRFVAGDESIDSVVQRADRTLNSRVALASFSESTTGQATINEGPANYIPRWIKPSGSARLVRNSDRPRTSQTKRADIASPFRVTSFQSQPRKSGTLDSIPQIEAAISEMATRPSESWNLGYLRDQANRLRVDSTAADQVVLEGLIERLNQYQKIKDDKQKIAATSAANLPPRSSDLNVRNLPFEESDINASEVGTGVLSAEARKTAYTETGYLVRVRSTRNDAPEYALVNADGEVQVFVTPQPGLNLSTYVRREVGVFGRRGYLYRLKTQHVTVDRIVDLARHKHGTK